MLLIEDNTVVNQSLTHDKITDLMFPHIQPTPVPIHDAVVMQGLDDTQSDLSLITFLSVTTSLQNTRTPPWPLPHMDTSSPNKKGVRRNAISNLLDTEDTTIESHIVALHVPPFATKTCFTEFLHNNFSRFYNIHDVVMGQYQQSAEYYGAPNIAFVYVNSG